MRHASPFGGGLRKRRARSDAQQAEAIEHTVVFETNGGTAYEQIRVLDGAIVTTPTEPTRPGYTFEGWFADKDCTLPFEFPHTIKATDPETICVYAKWVEVGDNVIDNEVGINYIEGNYDDDAPYYFAIYSDCIFPQSSDEYLSYYDVSGLDMDGVQRAINEIYARNGYIFQSSATERDYFESQPWYYGTKTDMDAVTAQFNEYERENVKLLQDYRASL